MGFKTWIFLEKDSKLVGKGKKVLISPKKVFFITKSIKRFVYFWHHSQMKFMFSRSKSWYVEASCIIPAHYNIYVALQFLLSQMIYLSVLLLSYASQNLNGPGTSLSLLSSWLSARLLAGHLEAALFGWEGTLLVAILAPWFTFGPPIGFIVVFFLLPIPKRSFKTSRTLSLRALVVPSTPRSLWAFYRPWTPLQSSAKKIPVPLKPLARWFALRPRHRWTSSKLVPLEKDHLILFPSSMNLEYDSSCPSVILKTATTRGWKRWDELGWRVMNLISCSLVSFIISGEKWLPRLSPIISLVPTLLETWGKNTVGNHWVKKAISNQPLF